MRLKTKQVFKVAQKVRSKIKYENKVKNKFAFMIWHTKVFKGGQQRYWFINEKNLLQKI